jgi:catechol 2,3-dioxygenase-like lactoylglutathione lyase family enzyme
VRHVITGAHTIIYTRDADADRAFLRDVLGLEHVDAGGGWLIFALPPGEVACHPSERDRHQLYLMCDELDATIAELHSRGADISGDVVEERWGRLTSIRLPGGGELGLYEPHHPIPAR